MKQIKNENKILIMLAFFSISIGLWGNFRQLWLQDNNFSIIQISNIISIGTFASAVGIMLIGRYVTLNKLKKSLAFILIIKSINMMVLYYLNGTMKTQLIQLSIIIDIIMEYIIVTSIYPLLVTIVKSDTIYSKRKLVEYLFRDIGILLGGIFIGKIIAGILVNYNICLIISNIFLIVSIITIINIKISYIEKSKYSKEGIFKKISRNKIILLYLLYVFISKIAISTGLGLKMLTLTNYFNFSDSVATNYLLIVGLIADVIGIIALKYLTPKNDYITITIKFGIRFIGYIIAFLSNNLIIIFIAITCSILISTAYENICDGVYINRIENEYQLAFANIREIIGFLGEAIGLFFCGIMYNQGLKYMFGLSAVFMIFQIGLAYYLIHLRRVEKVKDE